MPVLNNLFLTGLGFIERFERLYITDNFSRNSRTPGTFEIDINTLSIIKNNAYFKDYYGIGGIKHKLFAANISRIAEVVPDTITNKRSMVFDGLRGVGGIELRLFGLETNVSPIYFHEIDPVTLSSIKRVASNASIPLMDIGGTNDQLFSIGHDDVSNPEAIICELDPDTLSIIKTVNISGIAFLGIGGINQRLFAVKWPSAIVYELNPSTLSIINSASVAIDYPGGIGGIKT